MNRRDAWSTLALVAATLLAGGCTEGAGRPAGAEGGAPIDALSCEEQPDPLCQHPLNEVLIPELRGLGLTPAEAEPAELCRRLSVDLIGRIPRPDELARCLDDTPEQRVERMLDSPEHELVQRRQWAKDLGYRVGRTVYWQVIELDELVTQMVRGELGYGDFARRAIVHPGFFGPRLDGSWAAGVFNVFLGRPPRRDEMDGLMPLSRQLQGRVVCDGRIVEGLYEICLREVEAGEREGPCQRTCQVLNVEGGFFECGCSLFEDENLFEGTGPSFGCAGDGLGELVDLGVTECYDLELARLTDYTAGDADRCPERPAGCTDLAYEFGSEGAYAAAPLPAAPAGPVAALDAIGRALTARADFWEAAVDRELRQLLGWWKSGFRQPDVDRPAIRQLLAEELRRGGDLREIRRLIVTSLLYTAPAAAPMPSAGQDPTAETTAPVELPPWATGPVKLLSGERWLSSASVVVGEVLGVCDHRFIDTNVDLADGIAYLSGQADRREPTIDVAGLLAELGAEELDDETIERAYALIYELANYASLARGLGGCRADPPPRSPSLSQIANEADAASLLCSLGRDAVPPGLRPTDTTDGDLTLIAEHLVGRALGRGPDDDELSLLVDELRGCLDDGACPDALAASRWLCARLLDSTLFAAY